MEKTPRTVDDLNAWSPGTLPGLLGIRITELVAGGVTGEMPVRPDLLAPNGYLHAASVVGLADTVSGYGCRANLPDGAIGFTTIELKSNFLGTA
ncbi:MAG TPA: PaaI family thioesterase, partial [Thermomicrobiales bacterium]|nr:PaaI family thioesterase [Thermomicrobiales bacterium]